VPWTTVCWRRSESFGAERRGGGQPCREGEGKGAGRRGFLPRGAFGGLHRKRRQGVGSSLQLSFCAHFATCLDAQSDKRNGTARFPRPLPAKEAPHSQRVSGETIGMPLSTVR